MDFCKPNSHQLLETSEKKKKGISHIYYKHRISALGSISGAVYVFLYFDMFYIQWYRLAKKDVRNKVHMNEYQYEIQ
jgi:hypothetical protein